MKVYSQNKLIALGGAVLTVVALQLHWSNDLKTAVAGIIVAAAGLLGGSS